MKQRTPEKQEKNKEQSGRTNVPGQNTRQDDSPDKDLYHDENRRNQFDPETAKAINPPKQPKQS